MNIRSTTPVVWLLFRSVASPPFLFSFLALCQHVLTFVGVRRILLDFLSVRVSFLVLASDLCPHMLKDERSLFFLFSSANTDFAADFHSFFSFSLLFFPYSAALLVLSVCCLFFFSPLFITVSLFANTFELTCETGPNRSKLQDMLANLRDAEDLSHMQPPSTPPSRPNAVRFNEHEGNRTDEGAETPADRSHRVLMLNSLHT